MDDVESSPRSEIATKKRLLAEGLFHLIGDRIVQGELAPGTRIRDVELAAELDVSRTPVREALQRLERIGLVTMYPSRYTEVTSLSAEQIDMAREFEGLQAGIMARLACARMTPEQAEHACALIRAVARDLTDPAATARARRTMIDFLAARSGNTLLQTLIDDASLALARALDAQVTPAEEHPLVLAACEDLERAVRERDADAAEQACRRMYGIC